MADPFPLRPPLRAADAAKEERLEVLRMLEAGAITADDAARLLDALDGPDRPSAPPASFFPDAQTEPVAPRARHVRIRVGDGGSGRNRVNLTLPLAAIDVGLGIAERFAPSYIEDTEALRKAITAAAPGPIIDVEGEDGERVQISVE